MREAAGRTPTLPFPLRYNQRFGMSVATLQDKLTASGARLGNYRGADTPASFGDIAAELQALLEGCAVFDMSWQAKLIFSGRDRVRWLNGMVTNNVRDLALGHGVYSFILTPQGHNQGDLVAYNRGDYLLATTDREQAPKITASARSATSSWMMLRLRTSATSWARLALPAQRPRSSVHCGD